MAVESKATFYSVIVFVFFQANGIGSSGSVVEIVYRATEKCLTNGCNAHSAWT